MRSRAKLVVALCGLCALVMFGLTGTGLAQQTSVVAGTEDWLAGALPPPGLHMVNYATYYHANRIKDGHGDNVSASAMADPKVTLGGVILRPIYVSEIKIMGANLGWHAVVPVLHKSMDFDNNDPNRAAGTKDGVGDIAVSPFLLGWHTKNLHAVLGLDVFLPTGKYAKHDDVNLGSRHWTIEPAFAVTWMTPVGIEASAKFMYDFHGKNDRENNRKGQDFHMDYLVGYRITESFGIGAAGYYWHSTQLDRDRTGDIRDSEMEVFAIGPSVLYNFTPKRSLTAKVLFETKARNRPEGVGTWLKLVYSF